MPKSSKEKTKKTTDNITATADLKFDYYDERTWVNKDKFYEFKQQYDETQDNSSLNDANNIQYNIEVLIRNIITKKEDLKKAFPPMQVVYGGLNAIKLFLKNVIIETVYAYEDSGYEILEINLVRLYINSKRQYKNTNFSNIKMYNLVFNYRGYMLDMIETKTPNSCVPEYILNTLNNPNEKDGRKKIAKLTLQDTLNDLGMKCIDEGCNINQIADFCNKRKIIYYALDYRYKLFETNKDKGFTKINSLPKLVFMSANNHLYPITDKEERETIFKKS